MATALPKPLETSPCRYCGSPLERTFLDLGAQPPSNSYLRPAELARMEKYYPLHAFVCSSCMLVQLEAFHAPEEIFSDYAYFSSYSESWLQHARRYCDMAIERFRLGPDHQVIEVASNDGYLLKNFVGRNIPALGIEPAANVAHVARERGVPTRIGFFGRATANNVVAEGNGADLLIANNVLAHVPDLNDFVAGLRIVLKPEGVLTIEFPHLLRLIEDTQFDTIYHEHFSYFSFHVVETIFAAHGLRLFDVEELPTHGGSLRIYGCHQNSSRATEPAVDALRARELAAGLGTLDAYDGFGEQVKAVKRRLLAFLIKVKDKGRSVVGYGAAAKGNTLLNFCGVGPDLLDYVVDANPHKSGLYMPGSHIPIERPERIRETRPDYVLILPWNLSDEIMQSNDYIRSWGGQFVLPIPTVRVIR